jgi:hypothetical protein
MTCASTELLLVTRQISSTGFVICLIIGQFCKKIKIKKKLKKESEAENGDPGCVYQIAWLGTHGDKDLWMKKELNNFLC